MEGVVRCLRHCLTVATSLTDFPGVWKKVEMFDLAAPLRRDLRCKGHRPVCLAQCRPCCYSESENHSHYSSRDVRPAEDPLGTLKST
jgi:hypothetical protein